MTARCEPVNKSKTKNGGSTRQKSPGQPDKESGNDGCAREHMIAKAAYFRAEQRGFEPGDEMTDWLQAEADVKGFLVSETP